MDAFFTAMLIPPSGHGSGEHYRMRRIGDDPPEVLYRPVMVDGRQMRQAWTLRGNSEWGEPTWIAHYEFSGLRDLDDAEG